MNKAETEPFILAALEAAASGNWETVSIAEIAATADVSPRRAELAFADKRAVLREIAANLDRVVEANLEPDIQDPELPIRDRLFDVLMARFEAMAEHHAGYSALLRAAPRHPAEALDGIASVRTSMRAALEAAGVPAAGLCGQLRIEGLRAIFLSCLTTWLSDETQDLSFTMRALDARLKKADEAAQLLRL
ncbi:MAG: hypothetical protein HOH65_06710 [Rhodospirillaceae bacterium]|nr:hypothetical protein [Rhodospirillaceae bacterium]